MNVLFDNKVIIACSTGLEKNSAISVIRISGFKEISNLSGFFSKNIDKLRPRQMTNLDIVDNKLIIDNVLVCFFKAPNSYNGENLLEIYAHGNMLNTKNIINLFTKKLDIRMALPGEFTYRAVKNKKMSITQAEGLDLFLNANNGYMLKQGMDVIQGELHSKFLALYDAFKIVKANFELQVDFLEDIGEEKADNSLKRALQKFEEILQEIYRRTLADRSTLLTPKIVIVGRPNAGKSTFFNRILGVNRSIVSSTKGTTRDYVSEYIQINGNEFQIIDTAGLRSTNEKIELEGIKRTNDLIKTSFFKILILNPNETNQDDIKNGNLNNFDVILVSHIDDKEHLQKFTNLNIKAKSTFILTSLINEKLSSSFGPIEPKTVGPIEPETIGPIEPETVGPIEPETVGPIEPETIGPIEPRKLLGYIEKKIDLKYCKYIEKDPIIIERQRKYIQSSYNKYLKLKEILSCNKDIAICLSELSLLENELHQLIGIVPSNDVLDAIFENFCIGK